MSTTKKAALKSIYEVLMEVWNELPDYLKKDGVNSKMGYKYISERKIKEYVNPLFKKHGVIFKVDVTNPQMMPIGEKGRVLTTVEVKYSFILVENPEERITGSFIGQGADNGDKGIYKAITGAVKYVFMNLFLVPTGDDPENEEGFHSSSKSHSHRTTVTEPAIENAKALSRRLFYKLKTVDPEQASKLTLKYKGKLNTLAAVKEFNTEIENLISAHA